MSDAPFSPTGKSEAIVGLAKDADDWHELALAMCRAQSCNCDVELTLEDDMIRAVHDDWCGIFQFRNRELS